jgi:hypothetical protein
LKIDDSALDGKEGATLEHATLLRSTGSESEHLWLNACAIYASGTGPNGSIDYESGGSMT